MQYNPQNGQPYPVQHANGGAAPYPYVPQQYPSSGSPQSPAPQGPTNGTGGKGNKNNKGKKEKKKRPMSFYVAIVIAVVAVVAAGIFAFTAFAPSDSTSKRDPNGIIGQLEGKSEEEIIAELNRIIEEGMFNISIAALTEFDSGTSEGELKIENVPNNRYLMQVDITRNDTGEQIYESGILDPNMHIQKDKLDVDLPAGTYECTATFHALDMETEEEVGTAAAVITIVVKS